MADSNGRTERALTGMTGVYFVAAELGLRGFIATVTSRNAPGVDILAVGKKLECSVSIQVKANSPAGKHNYWLLGKRAQQDRAKSLFYVFVNLRDKGMRPDYFVVPSRTVARGLWVHKNKTGAVWYGFDRDSRFKERWDLLLK